MKFFLNWKQNGNFAKIERFIRNIDIPANIDEIILFLPFPYLLFAKNLCQKENKKRLDIGTQNISAFSNGAYTGEVGADMLLDIGISKALVGHSERRRLFFEEEKDLLKKILNLQEKNITPVLCIGETLEIREKGNYLEILDRQLEIYRPGCIVAYEPIWSIGTGLVPLEAQIEEVAVFIKEKLGIKILYGGSINEENIGAILKIPNVEGALIGNASLFYEKVNKMLHECLLLV